MMFSSFERGWSLPLAALLAGAALLFGPACGGAGGQGPGAAEPSASDDGGDAEGDDVGSDEGDESGSASAAPSNVPAPPSGARLEETRSMTLGVDLKLLQDGKQKGLKGHSWGFDEGRKNVIEKVSGNGVSRLAVIYGTREGKGLEDWTPLPTEGKGYTVKVKKGGGLEVLDADGNPAGAAETEVAESEFGYLGKPQPLLAQVIAAHPAEGDKISLDSVGALALIGYMPEMENREVTVVYQGTEQRDGHTVAALDVTFQCRLKELKAIYALDLKGPAYVDSKTGWVLQLDLSGKVRASGKLEYQGRVFDVEGGGKATFSRKATIR